MYVMQIMLLIRHQVDPKSQNLQFVNLFQIAAMLRSKYRCVEAAVLVTSFNLLLSFCLVWYTGGGVARTGSVARTGGVAEGGEAEAARLLLSLPEYQSGSGRRDETGSEAPAPDVGAGPEGGAVGVVALNSSQGTWDRSRTFQTHMFTFVRFSFKNIVPNFTSLHRWGPPGRISLPPARFASAPRPRWTDWTSWWSWYSVL